MRPGLVAHACNPGEARQEHQELEASLETLSQKINKQQQNEDFPTTLIISDEQL
jgi:hypothetical protein